MKQLSLSLFIALVACTAPAAAAPIECATGDLARYGTTVKSIPGVPDSGVTSTGEIIEAVDAINLITLADIKKNQLLINSSLERGFSDIKLYCKGGLMGNKQDCKSAKRKFLDTFAWAYNTKTPIDCKYSSIVSEKTQNKITANPIQFLKISRFGCGQNRDQLCCTKCLVGGSVSDSAGW